MSTFSKIVTQAIAVTTAGGAGVATGNAASRSFKGGLYAVHINYNAAAPATTVVTLTDTFGAVVAFAASATDKRWYPRSPTCDAAGAAIAGLYEVPMLVGPVTVTLTASNALTDAAIVTLFVLEA